MLIINHNNILLYYTLFVSNTLLDGDQTVGVRTGLDRGPMRGTPPIKDTTTDNTCRIKYT